MSKEKLNQLKRELKLEEDKIKCAEAAAKKEPEEPSKPTETAHGANKKAKRGMEPFKVGHEID